MMNKLSNDLQSDKDFMVAVQFLKGKGRILNKIIDPMGDGLSIQDTNMRIVYQNKFMVDHFGPHVGEYCYNIYENRDKVCDNCPIIEAYRTGKVAKALRVGTTKEGGRFRFENIASILTNEDGEIVAGMELVRLVEEREQAFDELRATKEKLEAALANIRTLQGFLPICACCKKIRDDKGYWNQIEVYIREHSYAEFSHSICPECAKKLYPDLDVYPHGSSEE